MASKSIELLSPAKNLEYGIQAINCGADAVYIGAPFLNARIEASNSIEDIEKLCRYAHKYHAKVYVALNTIIFDNELSEAEKTIKQIYEAGADALIIQDFGILEMNLPPIPLHASTQMNNRELEHILFLEKVGFTRVVLARELTFEQIKNIAQNTNIELEVFIHGAVCVSYSGQCYLSHFLGKRSGNRGNCAQPCRLSYDLLDDKNRTILKNTEILSLRDINRAAYIHELIKTGVSSFKIEGRLKDLAYVKNVTAYYRKIIDNIILQDNYEPVSLGKCVFDFEPDVEKTFNRGYSVYFLDGKRNGLKALGTKSLGKYLGKVIFSNGNKLKIDTSFPINNGDGLVYIDKEGHLNGFRVNKFENGYVYTFEKLDIEAGTDIYRNFDKNFEQKLTKNKNYRKIDVKIKISNSANKLIFDVLTNDGKFKISHSLETNSLQLAKNSQQLIENLKKNLAKTADTIFEVEEIVVDINQPFFMTFAQINSIRRTIFEKLEKEIFYSYQRFEKSLNKVNLSYYKKILNYKANIANRLAKKFFTEHGSQVVEDAFELSFNKQKPYELMRTKYCIAYELKQCPKFFQSATRPKYLIYNGKRLVIRYDCKNCEMVLSNL